MKKILLAIIVVGCFAVSAMAFIKPVDNGPVAEAEGQIVYLMSGKTTTGAGDAIVVYPAKRTIHAKVEGTGAVTATVRIQVSNDGVTWIDATATPHIALSGTTSASDGFVIDAKWAYIRAYVDAISAGAKVTVYLGV